MEANYIDFPTILIYLFWFFFAGLVLYLHREAKREGYPLESDRKGVTVQGFPAVPKPRAPRAKHPALAETAANNPKEQHR
jgi:photosynthetic reaction center H subunit